MRFMILTFSVLAWAFYEMSGGGDFAPPEVVPAPRIAHAEPPGAARATEAPGAPEAAIVPASFGEPRVVVAASDFAPPDPVAAIDAAVAAAIADEPALETRTVRGSRVNMRMGPGTDHPVVTVLSRGEATEVLEIDGRWARIRAAGEEGWMALSMLSEAG